MKASYDSIVKSLRKLGKIDAKKATILRMQLAWKDMREEAIAEINELLIQLPKK